MLCKYTVKVQDSAIFDIYSKSETRVADSSIYIHVYYPPIGALRAWF